MSQQLHKTQQLQQLHQQDRAFIIPNPWDLGSAIMLQNLGFKALATTSSALAYTLGKCDGQVTLEEKLSHCRTLAKHTNIPISADFENGFSDDPKEMVENIKKLVETGVSGCSIEDYSRGNQSIYGKQVSIDRVEAAAEYISKLDIPFQLTARAENLLHGVDDIEDTISRLRAYQEAGADVLYAPGIDSLSLLKQVTTELDKPFNVLAPFIKGASVDDLERSGATRISLGGALNWSVVSPLISASREMLTKGTFDWTAGITPSEQVNQILKDT